MTGSIVSRDGFWDSVGWGACCGLEVARELSVFIVESTTKHSEKPI